MYKFIVENNVKPPYSLYTLLKTLKHLYISYNKKNSEHVKSWCN